MGIWHATSYSTNIKKVLTCEGNRRADLKIVNIRVAQQIDMLVDVTLRHDFIRGGRDGGLNHGKLQNPLSNAQMCFRSR